MALHAIISLTCLPPTVDGLRALVDDADAVGADGTLELLDGGHARIAGMPSLLEHSSPSAGTTTRPTVTLNHLRAYAAAAGHLDGATPVEDGDAICVDLPVLNATTIGCGDHIGATPNNVLVTTSPACADHPA